jgi:hypothetical protein
MSYGQPTGSKIRQAHQRAVGGAQKRCRKGKNCSAACIQADKTCLVALAEPVNVAATKVSAMLQKRQGGGGGGSSSPEATPASVKGASPQPTGINAIQKIADDAELARAKQQVEVYKQKWAETIGKGDLEKTKQLSDTWQMLKKEADALQKEHDDKYNRPTPLTPKEAFSQESKRVKDRIQDRINQNLDLYKGEQRASILANREENYKDFKKLSDNQLASLGLYGGNKDKYYMDVNRFLRTGSLEGIPAERHQIVQEIASNMKTALNRLPASKETEFSRAVSGQGARNLSNLKVGDVIEDKGFGSYTLRNRVGTLDQFLNSGDSNAVMHVTSRNARDVSPMMEYQRESEHILRPGARLRVVKVMDEKDPNAHRSRKVGTVPTYIFEEVE